MKAMRRGLLALSLAAGISLGSVAQAEATTNYTSGRCWPSGATSAISLVASSWWYDPPQYGKRYHYGMANGSANGYSFSRFKLTINGISQPSIADGYVSYGDHNVRTLTGYWYRNTVDGTTTVTCSFVL